MKKCLLILASVAFLLGTFPRGVYELAHTLSHRLTDGHVHHSYHSHGDPSDHEHTVLDSSRLASELTPDTPITPDDRLKFSYDKILQIVVPETTQTPAIGWMSRKIPLFDPIPPTAPFRYTPTPPPDCLG